MPDGIPATDQSLRFARRSLQVAGVLCLAGCLYAMVFAGFAGMLTPIEWLTIPPMMIISLAVIVALQMLDAPRIQTLGLIFTGYGTFYILANTAWALLLTADYARAFIFLSWTPILYLFAVAVVRTTAAKILCWTSVTTLYLFVGLLVVFDKAVPPGSGTLMDPLYILLLIQPAMVLLIFGVGEFRDHYVAERVRNEQLSRNRTVLAQAAQVAERGRVEADEANAAKSQFLARMSHEFRTPLNGIIGLTEVLMQRVDTAGEAGRDDKLVGVINSSGQHLLSLVNDFLDLSRLETDQASLEEENIDVVSVMRDCAQICSGPDFGTGNDRIVMTHDPDLPKLFADARAVTQMIVNLLSNALKFSDPKTQVLLRAQVRLAGQLIIEVEDKGIGIAANDIPHLTQPFYQVDGTSTRQHAGTGLGLAIVANQIERHEGSLEIHSQPGQGTRMTLIFPASRLRHDSVEHISPAT